MERKTDSVMVNLKILAKVPRNGRIRKTRFGNITLESESIMLPFKRALYQDNRHQAMVDIQGIVQDAFTDVRTLMNSKYLLEPHHSDEQERVVEKLTIFYRELENSITGLENLKVTYADDISTTATLDLIIEKINLQLAEIRRKFPDIHPENSVDKN